MKIRKTMTTSIKISYWRRYLSLRFLTGKIQEKGVIWCFITFLRKLYREVCRFGQCLIAPIKRKKIFLMNLINFHSNGEPKTIILGVWDFKLLPWSVGDFLIFIETLSVLKLKHGADKVDVCVVCDKENPAGNRGYKNINSSNFRYYLFSLLPIINTSPYLGSVFQFDSHSEFYSFLKQNINKYIIYPPINEQLKETFNFYGGQTRREILDFYRKYKFIPYFSIDDYHLGWACNFYKTKAKGLLPVTVSLRNRPDWAARNADRDTWIGFFDLCRFRFPNVVFVIVGLREEVCDKLRVQSNVIIAKDYGSTLVDDFALTRASLLYMGIGSGISEIAVYSDVPYLIFHVVPQVAKQSGLEPNFPKWEFAVEHQKVFHTSFVITSDSLLKEFSNLYNRLDAKEWHKKASSYEQLPYSFVSWYR